MNRPICCLLLFGLSLTVSAQSYYRHNPFTIYKQSPPSPHGGFQPSHSWPLSHVPGFYNFHQQSLQKVNLFTPNTINEPAETAGQVDMYNKALEEEAEEAIKELNAVPGHQFGFDGLYEAAPRSYVSVEFGHGGNNAQYRYAV